VEAAVGGLVARGSALLKGDQDTVASSGTGTSQRTESTSPPPAQPLNK
jgi:hypothetical protein